LSSRKLKIAFDLDGVLVDTESVLFPSLSALSGKVVTEVPFYDLREVYGVSEQELYQTLDITCSLLGERHLFSEAVDLVRELWSRTNEPIYIVTFRDIHNAHHTHRLVSHFGVPYVLVFAGRQGSKSLYLKDYPFFVEDCGEAAVKLAEEGHYVFLIDKSYNQGYEHRRITRVGSIGELKSMLDLFVRD